MDCTIAESANQSHKAHQWEEEEEEEEEEKAEVSRGPTALALHSVHNYIP